MKTFMSALMTLTLWFSQVGIPVVYAAEEQQAAPEVNVGSRYTSDSNTKVESEKKGGSNVLGIRGLTMTSLTLFAAVGGSVAITMICWDQTSAKIFVASTALFAAMEILNWVSYKEASKRELAYYKNQDHDSQVKALEAAAKQTEEAAKSAQQRAMLAQTAAAGMIAAGAFALYEAIQADSACAASVLAGGAACTPATRLDFCKGALFGENEFERPFLKIAEPQFLAQSLKESTNNLDSYFLNNEIQSYFSGGTQSPKLADYENMKKYLSKNEKMESPVDLGAELHSFYNGIGEFIIPSAQAQGQITSIVAGVGSGIFAGMLAKSQTEFTFMKGGYVRAAGFAATGAMAYGAGVQIKGAADKMNQRAAEYRKLATSMNSKFADSGELANRSTQQRITQAPVGSVVSTDDNNGAAMCFTGSKPGDLTQDANCSCRATNSCKKSESPKIDHKTFSGAGLISNTAGLLGQTGNYLYSGNTKKANELAAKGGQLAARVNRLKKSLQDYANKKAVERGDKPIDFAGLEKKTQEKLINGINKAFNDMSDSQKSQLANFAPSLGTENGQVVAEAKPVEFKDDGPNSGRGGSGGSLASAGTPSGMDFKFDLDEKGEELPALEDSILNGENVAGVSLDEYDTTSGSDIAPQHEDIFKLIHTRYLKSAYPRFFVQRKEEF